MKTFNLAGIALMMVALAACDTTPSDPGPTPEPATMSFKQGAQYEFTSYQTDPSTGAEQSITRRTRKWTLANTSATVHGRSNVAVYIDSVIAGGPIITVADTIYLQQQTGTNDVYRYASLAPELDFAGTSIIEVDLGKQWMHESRLNASVARWYVGEAADTVQMDLNVPGLVGLKVAITDSAVASASENITINGTSYPATKTTHKLILSISAIHNLPLLPPITLKSESLQRTTWTVPSLGVIAREEREGKVLDVSGTTFGGMTIPSFTLPVPGYYSAMTRVVATGG